MDCSSAGCLGTATLVRVCQHVSSIKRSLQVQVIAECRTQKAAQLRTKYD